jgi:type IV pilus assembly protein PilB
MTVYSRRLLADALLREGLLSEEQLKRILNEDNEENIPLGRILLERGLIREADLLPIIERELKIPRVNLADYPIMPEAVALITAEMARRHLVLPLQKKERQVLLAMADPLNLSAIDDVAMVTGDEVNPVLVGESEVIAAIERYCNGNGQKNSSGPTLDADSSAGRKVEKAGGGKIAQAPVVKVVNELIIKAIAEGASDIHFEPSEKGLRIRMRLDGYLRDLAVPSAYKPEQVISRIKIMANLDIAEKRLPQDGNIQLHKAGQEINLRVSTMPTISGEKTVLRLLEKEKIVMPLEELGFTGPCYRTLQRLLLNQSGMVLVTGPTGCGKTTTLYSALNYLNHPEVNIITVEDPVECRLEGINQIQVNRKINRTFANTLRSILRQDPDIIMIGEIRDLETATIASQAALTGHLVLSTLHTNNAIEAVTRLIDMGLESYLVAHSLVGVLAQRLIRKICPHCLEEYSLSGEDRLFFKQFFQKEPPQKLKRGGKCDRCNQTGFRGRTAIQELLFINGTLQDLIHRGASALTIQEKAVEQGMQPLVKDGLRCLEEGITTMGEVVRTTFSSVFDDEAAAYAGSSAFLARLQRERD